MRNDLAEPRDSDWLRTRLIEVEDELARHRAGAVAASQPVPLLGIVADVPGIYAGVIEDASDQAGPNFRYVTASAAAQARFLDSLIGRHARDLSLPPETIGLGVAMIARCAASGRAETAEYELAVVGGERRWYLGTFAPVKVSPSGRARASFVATDITAGHARDAPAADSAAYFDRVEDSLFTVAVTADGRSLLEGLNPFGERRTGWSSLAARGRAIEDLLGVAFAADLRNGWQQARTSGRSWRIVRRLALPAGDGTFDMLLTPLGNATGYTGRLIVTAREITEQVRIAEELREAHTMQAIGQLTGGVAHDFNNLLTGITLSLELLHREVATARGLRLIAAAQRGAERGAKLTGQLLAFSRRQRLQLQVLDVNGVMSGMKGLLAKTLRPEVQVGMRLAPDLWPALADSTQLEVAVLNLAVNARDAMPAGGTIEIATDNVTTGPPTRGEDPPAGDFIAVRFSDDGTGMTADVLARAFEPFFTTKDVGLGSGLGLPQVLGVAKQLGGGVRLDSRPGQGTTVDIFLPRAAPERVAVLQNEPA